MDRGDFDVLMIVIKAWRERAFTFVPRFWLTQKLIDAGYAFEVDAALDQLVADEYLADNNGLLALTDKGKAVWLRAAG